MSCQILNVVLEDLVLPINKMGNGKNFRDKMGLGMKGKPALNRLDLKGKSFGELLVLEFAYVKNRVTYWKCLCSCGKEKVIIGRNLKSGNTANCGCIGIEKTIKRNKEERYYRTEVGENGLNMVYRMYRGMAKRNNREFLINIVDFKELTSSTCFYCGKEPQRFSNGWIKSKEGKIRAKYYYNGLDRLDNEKDYAIRNVVPCCRDCNFIKGRVTVNIMKKALKSLGII